MFVWRTDVILAAICEHAPELSKGLGDLSNHWTESGSINQAMDQVYPQLEKTDFLR